MEEDRTDESEQKTGLTECSSEKERPTSRRSVLQTAGLLAGGSVVSGVASGQQDYDTVTVGSYETRSFSVGSGETLENLLIDVTAPGALARINARGSGWTVRNVGVKGRITERENENTPLIVPAVDEGSTGVMENIYIGDGTEGPNNINGMWVSALGHEGTLVLRNFNVGNWSDNGIYASNPGVYDYKGQTGGMGEVHVESSYAHDNNISGFRIGTPGSYVKDSVVDNNGNAPPIPGGAVNARGIWAKERSGLTAVNCDISTNDGAVVATDEGGITLENCRVDGEIIAYGGGSVDGSSVGSPDLTLPAGVPTTPEEAATGTSSAGGGGSDDGSTSPALPNTLILETNEGGPLVEYEFTVDGDVSRTDVAETNDVVTANDDGTTTVTGVTGNGYTDGFLVDGPLVSWTASVGSEHYRVLLDGSEIQPGDGADGAATTDRPLAVQTSEGGPLVEYEITVDGPVEKTDSAEGNDSIATDGDGTTTVTGVTGNGYTDDYRVGGAVTAVSANVEQQYYQVLVDGTQYRQFEDRTMTVETDTGGPLVEYEFTVDGDVALGSESEDNDAVQTNDDGTTTVTGVTGNGYVDDYTVTGALVDWSASVDSRHYRIVLGESEIDPGNI